MRRQIVLLAALLALGAGSASQAADTLDTRIMGLARSWDHVNFETPASARADQAAKLAAQADALSHQFPGRAEPLVWKAIALATEAGARGGLGGLALCKEAKADLEQAEKIDPTALGDGSVYTSLGSLYSEVPGFPIGFGDKAKAKSYLRKALALNPNGLDANYYYGELMLQTGNYAEAERALQRALSAPARPGREVADHGRKAQAADLLAKARAHKG